MEATDRALALNVNYCEALKLKAALLRQRARFEKDSSVQGQFLAEADVFRARAAEIARRRRGGR